MKIIGIYKITFPSGGVYIGQSKNIKNRWSKYKNLACKDQPILYNAILKYGWDNCITEVLVCFKNYNDKVFLILNTLEIYYIKKFKELGNCYNIAKGGDNKIFSEEHKLSLSIAGKGRIFSEEHKRKISESRKGKPMHENTKLKLLESITGRVKSNKELGLLSKKVYQYSLDGILINEYNSIKEATIAINGSSGNISKCCTGKSKTAYGFIWKHKDNKIDAKCPEGKW